MKRSLVWCSALVVSAAWAGPFGAHSASADPRDAVVAVVYPLPSLGVAATQLVQVNVANVSAGGLDPSETDLVVRARLLDANGAELARSEGQAVPLGATFTWLVARAELAGAGADALGRIQLRAEIGVVGPLETGAFVPSLELVDERTGVGSGMIGDVRTVISGEAAFQSAPKDFY